MLYRFTFKSDDQPKLDIQADTRDILTWEREKSGRKASNLAAAGVEDYYSIAHAAARRTDVYSGSLREFERAYYLLRVEEVVDDETGEVDEGGPTQPGR